MPTSNDYDSLGYDINDAIARLDAVIQRQDLDRAHKIVNLFKQATGIHPYRWTITPDGKVEWFGFTLGREEYPWGGVSEPQVVTYVVDKPARWYRERTTSRYVIRDARAARRLLTEHTPA